MYIKVHGANYTCMKSLASGRLTTTSSTSIGTNSQEVGKKVSLNVMESSGTMLSGSVQLLSNMLSQRSMMLFSHHLEPHL